MKKICTIICLALLTGCYYDSEDELYPKPVTPPPPAGGDSVSYNTQIKPIINQKCATSGCHDATGLGGGYNFTSYEGVKPAMDNGRLMKAINWETGVSQMPKGQPKMDQASLDLFAKWNAEGYKNN